MRWGVLGPLLVHDAGGTPITPTGPARRLLLAALLSRANETVSADRLADDLWGDVPPRTAAKTLQSHLVRLRDDLGRDGSDPVIVTEVSGYRLRVDPDELDATRFAGALDSVDPDDPARTFATLSAALDLWRGAAYEDFPDADFLVAERLRLAELRELAEALRTDCALALGQDAELVPGLERRVIAAPYRERTWEQLMLALYRAGRQGDALAAFRRARDHLAGELGVDPGPALRDLETRILRHDPTLLERWTPQPPVLMASSGVCPYRGLTGYRGEDASLFVGRERLTARLVGLCAEHAVVVVTGASGAGKSSLVRAGLIPALRAGALPGSAAWRTRVVTATDLSTAPLAADETADLLVIDQAEQLLSETDAATRNAVLQTITTQIDAGGRVVVVMRGDFYGRLVELAPLDRYAATATLLVGPMRDDDLARVVTVPAARSGLEVDPALVDAVLDDMTGRAGALPLLSVALVRTWENRSGDRLDLGGYHKGGGVAGAVEAAAEECFAALDAEAAAAARRILLRLCTRRSGDWTARPQPTAALVDDDGPSERALDTLLTARLVTVGAGDVQLAHEALLDQWPRLREWLTERELDAETVAHLGEAARAWAASGRTDADLYRGARLAAAEHWAATHPADVSGLERDFLDAARTAATAELDRERARGRRLRRVAVALVVVATLAIASAAVALSARRTAAHNALTADARRLAAEALAAPDLRTSLLLAAAAFRLQDSPDTRAALLGELERGGSAVFHVPTLERVLWVGASEAGGQLWWMDNTRTVTRYDVRRHRVSAQFPARGDRVVAVSPDGRRLLTAGPRSFDDAAGATRATVLDAVTGAAVQVLPSHVATADDLTSAFTRDGRWLVVPTTAANDGAPGDGLDIYATTDVAHPARHVTLPSTVTAVAAGEAAVVALDRTGRVARIAPASGRVETATRVSTDAATAPLLAVDRDDAHVAIAAADAPTVTLADLDHPTAPVAHTPDVGAAVDVAAYADDGKTFAVGYSSGAVDVFDTDGSLRERMTGTTAAVQGLSWSGASASEGLYTGGLDAQVVSWDVDTTNRLLQPETGPQPPLDLGVSSRTSFVSLAPPQGNVAESREQLVAVDLASHRRHAWPLGLHDDESVSQISVARDRPVAMVAVIEPDRRFRYDVWDLTLGRRIGSFTATSQPSPHQSFGGVVAADGRSAVVNVGDRRLEIVTLPAGRPRGTVDVVFRGEGAARTLAIPFDWSLDDRLLVQGFDPGPRAGDAGGDALATLRSRAVQQVALVDVQRHRTQATSRLTPLGLLQSTAWSRDGRLLAIGAGDGNLWVLDGKSLAVRAGPVTAVPGTITAVAFAPDGRSLAAAGDNGALSFWSAVDLRPLGTGLTPAGGAWPFARFSADGSTLDGLAPAEGNDQQWVRVATSPRDWVRLACSVAGTPLTRVEWSRFVGDRPYRSTC